MRRRRDLEPSYAAGVVRRVISVKIVILAIVWALFVSAVIQFGQLLQDGGFDKHPTGATALLVVCGFLAGGCYSLTRLYLRERREDR